MQQVCLRTMFFTHNVHVSVVHFLRLALRLMFSFPGSQVLLRFLASSLCRASCILVITTRQLSCGTRQRTIFVNLARSASMFGYFFYEGFQIEDSLRLGQYQHPGVNAGIRFRIKISFFAWCVVNSALKANVGFPLN